MKFKGVFSQSYSYLCEKNMDWNSLALKIIEFSLNCKSQVSLKKQTCENSIPLHSKKPIGETNSIQVYLYIKIDNWYSNKTFTKRQTHLVDRKSQNLFDSKKWKLLNI
jgi:hypothetical protein